ncbi:MAG: hypothetical protein J5781_00680 [Clostridia bacterium]|nr:hypothetical protein [Clostridia bacterium]
MRKIVLRIFTAISVLIALFFVIFLLMTVFGKVEPEEFDNSIVKTLCLALGGVFFASSVVEMVLMYSDNDAIKEILLHYQKGGTAKSSVSVVRKLTKENVKSVEGVQYRRCKVYAGEYGVRLKVWIAIKDRDMKDTEDLLRSILEDAFLGTLGFKFYAIDFHLKKIEAKYKVDISKFLCKKASETTETTEQEEPVSEIEATAIAEQETSGEEVAEDNIVAVEAEETSVEEVPAEEAPIEEEAVEEEPEAEETAPAEEETEEPKE